MIITVASGKGGTGKTSVAVNLASALANCQDMTRNHSVWLADCDVEAPNDALFLSPVISRRQQVKRMIPEINETRCNLCGRCIEVCTYNAIAIAGNKAMVFKELCHACGSCAAQCPQKAISEIPEPIGTLQKGNAGDLNFIQGELNIGFSSPTPVIRELKKQIVADDHKGTVIIRDASPGASCPVVECLRDSNFALLVTEPTPFGLHDLKLVAEVIRQDLQIPAGVVINKSNGDDPIIQEYCEETGLPILMRIPLSRSIAETYSRGELLIHDQPEYQERFCKLFSSIETIIDQAVRVN